MWLEIQNFSLHIFGFTAFSNLMNQKERMESVLRLAKPMGNPPQGTLDVFVP